MVEKLPMIQVCSDAGNLLCIGNEQVGSSGNTFDSYLSYFLLELFLFYSRFKLSSPPPPPPPVLVQQTPHSVVSPLMLHGVRASVMQHHSVVTHPFPDNVNMMFLPIWPY